eukprot:scaffold22815_cov60-Phaeocystis_antarctica.AAC.3
MSGEHCPNQNITLQKHATNTYQCGASGLVGRLRSPFLGRPRSPLSCEVPRLVPLDGDGRPADPRRWRRAPSGPLRLRVAPSARSADRGADEVEEAAGGAVDVAVAVAGAARPRRALLKGIGEGGLVPVGAAEVCTHPVLRQRPRVAVVRLPDEQRSIEHAAEATLDRLHEAGVVAVGGLLQHEVLRLRRVVGVADGFEFVHDAIGAPGVRLRDEGGAAVILRVDVERDLGSRVREEEVGQQLGDARVAPALRGWPRQVAHLNLDGGPLHHVALLDEGSAAVVDKGECTAFRRVEWRREESRALVRVEPHRIRHTQASSLGGLLLRAFGRGRKGAPQNRHIQVAVRLADGAIQGILFLPVGLARPRAHLQASLLVGCGCVRLILDAHQGVRVPVTAGRVPVENRPLAVPSGVRAAKRHPPVCAGVHLLEIVVLQGFPRRVHGLLHRGRTLALYRIALAVGAAGELPGLLVDARV